MLNHTFESAWRRYRARLSADELTALAEEQATIMRTVHGTMGESPSSPPAQAVAARWLALTERIHGVQVPLTDHVVVGQFGRRSA